MVLGVEPMVLNQSVNEDGVFTSTRRGLAVIVVDSASNYLTENISKVKAH